MRAFTKSLVVELSPKSLRRPVMVYVYGTEGVKTFVVESVVPFKEISIEPFSAIFSTLIEENFLSLSFTAVRLSSEMMS